MVFLDPKSDMVFKKLFGHATHKNVLMSFLNSVLERSENKKIVDITINDPTNLPETIRGKTTIVDVRCTDQAGHQYIVEMQVITQKDYPARAQYYSALALSRQLTSKEKYENLVPVIFVGVLDFTLFTSDHYLSHHLILDNKTHAHELKHLEFHFIELSKFNKKLEQLTTDLDKWVYFFNHAMELGTIPPSLKNPIMQEAFDVLEQGSWSKGELEAYDRYLDAIRSAAGQLDAAWEGGLLEGKKQIIQALVAAKTMPLEEIARVTELDLDEIKKLVK